MEFDEEDDDGTIVDPDFVATMDVDSDSNEVEATPQANNNASMYASKIFHKCKFNEYLVI